VAKERIVVPARRVGIAWLGRYEGGRWPQHRHDELELNLGVGGRSTYVIEGRRVVVERDTLLALFPAQEHIVVEETPGAERWVVVWKPETVRRLMRGARADWAADRPTGQQAWRLEPARARALVGIFAAVRSAGDDVSANACLEALLLASWDAVRSARHGDPMRRVHPAIEQAVRRLRVDPTLDGSALARAVGLSRARLSRVFAEEIGVPLSAYRTRLRLERALERIHSGRVNLLAAALAAGFGSYAQFHRVVRERLGVSPRALIQEARQQ
jgi:AraC-like DNA-binding protein